MVLQSVLWKSMLKYIELGSNKPIKIVILMHGYGSNKEDMSSVAKEILEFDNKIAENVKFICPDGLSPWEGGNFMNARQWFSLQNRDDSFVHHGLNTASEKIIPFISDILKANNLQFKDLFLAGFSQGAMLSLHTGIDLPEKIAGIISFSGTLVRKKTLKHDAKIPQDIIFIHGDLDEVLPCTYSKIAHSEMQSVGWNSSFFEIKDMAHSINEECIRLAVGFVLKKL